MAERSHQERLHALLNAKSTKFTDLVEIAGLDPKRHFRGIDFGTTRLDDCDLTGYDFRGAKITNASFKGAIISGANFDGKQLRLRCLKLASDYLEFATTHKLLSSRQNSSDKNNNVRGAVSRKASISNVDGPVGRSPELAKLLSACQVNNYHTVDELLRSGINPNSSLTENGEIALAVTSFFGYLELVDLLISFEADVNKGKTDNGSTALMAASQKGHADIVDHLIAANADVNQGKTDNGSTALMAACAAGHVDVVDRLIAAHADVNQGKTDNGSTALMAACAAGHVDVVDRLIAAHADVNQGKTDNGSTALMEASRSGHIEIAELLVEAGAKINSRDKQGWSAIMFAALENKPALFDYLIKVGADILVSDSKGVNTLYDLVKSSPRMNASFQLASSHHDRRVLRD